jgi:hypothetical protein
MESLVNSPMIKPMVQTGYLLCIVVPGNEHNHVTPDRVEMNEQKAKEFVERNPSYEIYEVPVIIGYVEVGDGC